MKTKDADKITIGTCLRKNSKRGFVVIRVTSINKEWKNWIVQTIDCLDGRIFARDEVSFNYGYSDGYQPVDCERDFLRLHMMLKVQQTATQPLLEAIKNAEIAQIENVQTNEAR